MPSRPYTCSPPIVSAFRFEVEIVVQHRRCDDLLANQLVLIGELDDLAPDARPSVASLDPASQNPARSAPIACRRADRVRSCRGQNCPRRPQTPHCSNKRPRNSLRQRPRDPGPAAAAAASASSSASFSFLPHVLRSTPSLKPVDLWMHPYPWARSVAERNQVVVLAPAMTAHVAVGLCRPIGLNLFVDQTPDDLGGVEVKEARQQRQPRRRPSQPMLAARHIVP